MKNGTLIFSGVYFATVDGKVVTLSSGSVYPNISAEQLGMIEKEIGDMWERVRAINEKKR